uniref:asparagine synthase-related protein n=1 Tax=Acetatifactor sp. TaxID=1872090 RepID=UPI0040571681
MSAVWGTISFTSTLPENVDRIMRNPYETKCKIDRIESVLEDSCYMGCGIQYITEESARERLPIIDRENNIILSTDCILDNRNELLQKLSLTDYTLPDGEIVYHAYLKWGIDCVKHFRGLFTLVVWEQQSQTLYMANDHVSARCIYYYRTDDSITFSTLLAPIIALHKDISFNEMYLMDFLAAPLLLPTIVVPETPYKNIFKLPPATILTITQSETKQTTYWTPADPLTNCNCTTAEEYGSYFRRLLTDCVSDAIRTNGKKGIALSSGLDSSSVGTIAADLLQETGESLFAGTYVPYDSETANTTHKIYNETEDVNSIVSMHPNIIPHFLCNEGKNSLDSVPDGLNTLEIPYKAFVNYPNLDEIYTLASKEGCRVVLSGQMGNSTISYGNIDHVFYNLYKEKKFISLFKCLNTFATHMKISRKKFLPTYFRYLRKIDSNYTKEPDIYFLDNPFLSEHFKESYPIRERFTLGNMHFFSGHPNTQALYQEQLVTQPSSPYMGEWETKIGLKHGIILRDPTKDPRILSFCYHLPYHYYALNGMPKWLIRNNMKDMLPQHILANWDRHGIQNEDWTRRITRDWDSIEPFIKQALNTPELQTYIDTNQVLSLISKPDFSVSTQDINTNIYIFTVYIFSKYLSHS